MEDKAMKIHDLGGREFILIKINGQKFKSEEVKEMFFRSGEKHFGSLS